MSIKKKFAAEIGGTFTDIILFEDVNGKTQLKTLKVASTPSHPEEAVIEGADKLMKDWSNTAEMIHGSTVATNAVLERKGVSTALLVTEGFADTLEILRGNKNNIYDLFYQRPVPVVPRNLVYPVTERLSAQGEVIIPLSEAQIRQIAGQLKEQGVKSVGICFLHSYASEKHEKMAKKIIEEEIPDCIVTASYEILPQFREYERTSTVAITSYIAPVMVRYIESLYHQLQARGFGGEIFITQSNGGVIPMDALRKEVARTLLSGPAAGVTGAVFMAKQVGIEDIITLDIGGTSADVCLINKGNPLVSTTNEIDGNAIAVPMLDIVTVGAGGGSIAWIDGGGMLQVGPQSAGADPGPACYCRGGTKPTLSDAMAYRGLLRPDHFAGGNYKLDPQKSRKVIGEIAQQLGTTPDEMAEAICRVMEANTMQAVRLASTERGYDARNYTMVAFGGAGALMAASIAGELGMKKVLVPCYAGLLSSFGLLVADIIRDYVQTKVSLCVETPAQDLRKQFEKMQDKAVEDMTNYGFKRENLQFQYAVDARYQGQAFELQVDFEHIPENGEEITNAFHEVHRARYGFNSPHNLVEIVNYRLKTIVPQNNDLLSGMKYDEATDKEEYVVQKALMGGEWKDCRFYTWSRLPKDAVIQGPAVIEDETSTCVVPQTWTAKLQKNGSLILEKEEN